MDFDTLTTQLKARFADVTAEKPASGDPFVRVSAARVLEVLRALRETPEWRFDSLVCLSGADTGKELWIVYHLHSFEHRHRLEVKVVLDREDPEVDSVVALWAGAEFLEREAYDLYGIVFRNHPDLRRLLLPFDWQGWPGRKDYVYPVEYRGITLRREGQFSAEDVARSTAAREARDKELKARVAAEQSKGGGA
jgi:NADH-quinone oxidoreductase subunit C